MHRRRFLSNSLALSSGMLLYPFGGSVATGKEASDRRVRVAWIGGSAGRLPTAAYLEALLAGLREHGWSEGKNLVLDTRWGDRDRAADLIRELLAAKPDVLVAQGAMVLAARSMPSRVPIVFGFSGDPLEAGLIDSFARPGRHMTGIAMQSLDLVGKRLEILKDIVPSLARVGILANPAHPGEQLELRASQRAARALAMSVSYHPVSSARDFEMAFPALLSQRVEAIVAFPDALVMSEAKTIAAFSRHHSIPAVSGWSEFADDGNLFTYGPNLRSTWQQAASFVDRLLRGADPKDLPVEQPARFELVINATAAAELGLKIPAVVAMRAERIIN